MISINKKCKIQGQVTTLQIMPFTKNRKSLKKPTNFSSRYVRICIKDATPPQTFLSFHALLCHSPADCRTCCKNLLKISTSVYTRMYSFHCFVRRLVFFHFHADHIPIGAIPTTHLFCNRRGWDRLHVSYDPNRMFHAKDCLLNTVPHPCPCLFWELARQTCWLNKRLRWLCKFQSSHHMFSNALRSW